MATKPSPKKTVKTDFPPALEMLIPDISIAKKYVSRTIDDVRDLDALGYANQEHMNVLISGPTGPGKTMCAMAYCAANKIPFVSVPCDGAIESSVLFGRPSVDIRTNGLRWVWGPVSLAVMHGGMLYFDEINAMPGRIATSIHGLLDGRRILTLMDHPFTHIDPATGEYLSLEIGDPREETCVTFDGPAYIKAHENLFVVGTYNPGYHDLRPLNQAFENRFAMRLEFLYDETVEKELVSSAALRELAHDIREAAAQGEIQTPVSTNMLMEFERLAKAELNDAAGEAIPMYSFALKVLLNHFPVEERAAVQLKIKTKQQKLQREMGWEEDR